MSTDFERLNIILAARDREFARAMDRNIRRIERFSKQGNKNLSKTSKQFDLLGMAAKRLGPAMAALTAGAVIARLKNTVAQLDAIGKTADKIGLTTDALQELRTIAESAGVSQDALDMSMQRFSRRLSEAAAGSGSAKDAIKEMGLDAQELVGMGLDEALGKVADKVAAIEDPALRVSRAFDLFGREGVGMINLLREGSAGMEKMRAEARALGIVVDERLIRSAEDAQTQLDLMGRVIGANLNSALVELAPLLVALAEDIAVLARGLGVAINAVLNFLEPTRQLGTALDNVVLAMGDEIRQSQQLAGTLDAGITLSQSQAKAKLAEAGARLENARAAIAEHRAIALASDSYGQALGDVEGGSFTPRAGPGPTGSIDPALYDIGAIGRGADPRVEQGLDTLRDLRAVPPALAAHEQQIEQNMSRIETAIANSGGGNVVFDRVLPPAPISPGDRKEIGDTGGAARSAAAGLTDLDTALDGIGEKFASGDRAAGLFGDNLLSLNERFAAGEITQDQYLRGIEALSDRFDAAASASRSMEQSAATALSSIVTGSSSAKEALAGLASQFAGMAAQSAFSNLLSGRFGMLGALFAPAPSFAGGGFTGGGARTGGIDGRGGFPAILHPNESVIDHTRPAAGGTGAGSMSINVTVSGARGNTEISEMVAFGVRQGLSEYDRNILPSRVGQIRHDPRKIR